jgi:hypothetical protein
MKYQIINYNYTMTVVYAKVALDESSLEGARVFPISLDGVSSVSQLEQKLFTQYQSSLSARQRGTITQAVEDHVTTNTNLVIDLFAMASTSTAQTQTVESTEIDSTTSNSASVS